MAEKNTSIEYNLDKNSDIEGYKNEDTGDNESIVPDFDPNSSHIEVFSEGSSEVYSYHIDFGDEWDYNGPNTVNDAAITTIAKILNWTTNFTDKIIKLLLRISVSLYIKTLIFLWQKH